MHEIAEQIVDLSQLLAKSIEGKTPSTVKYYRACISSFRKFLGNDTIDVTDFDENDLSRFAAWLVDEKKSASTIKLYLMTLRAIFNNSVDDGNKVFANVSSKNDAETNLTTRDDILTVANASMSQYPALARVRDMFMFSFYTCGTSFECMKLMTLNDITDDYINHSRRA
ncbi:phage integrase SAM-like domain-containing protein [uncultured Muribaculum sp.]|uniref:phage integrase SAM-like domain-containing protein n=1 Tax=uncultured Muribaculum sp. TaxID=1918613 RepID=UPI0025B6BC44|nr:phage integrase SAM-like domain-containing protein [uncultured Muribaculum sp.]